MVRNVMALQQSLTNITIVDEKSLDYARQYYELYYSGGEVRVILGVRVTVRVTINHILHFINYLTTIGIDQTSRITRNQIPRRRLRKNVGYDLR